MWWTYVICGILCLGVGVGAGIGIEKLGQFLYFKRLGMANPNNNPKKKMDE